MAPTDSNGLAQGASAPVIDCAAAAGISLPPGFAPRARAFPAFAAAPEVEPATPAPLAVS